MPSLWFPFFSVFVPFLNQVGERGRTGFEFGRPVVDIDTNLFPDFILPFSPSEMNAALEVFPQIPGMDPAKFSEISFGFNRPATMSDYKCIPGRGYARCVCFPWILQGSPFPWSRMRWTRNSDLSWQTSHGGSLPRQTWPRLDFCQMQRCARLPTENGGTMPSLSLSIGTGRMFRV